MATASKAHKVHARRLPAVRQATIVVEFSCPSGCLTGYFWTNDEKDAERVTQAVIGAHYPNPAETADQASNGEA